MKTEDLLREIESLPVEERARVADSVLKTLNPTESQIDEKWAEVAKRRLDEIKANKLTRHPSLDVQADEKTRES